MKRISAYVMGCVALALSFLAYAEYIHMLGFPDGFISELQSAQRRLAYIFIGISVILGLRFLYLGSIASREEISKRLFTAIFVYLISIVGVLLVDYYYRSYLPGSVGG
jgi:hypothetical protein